MPRKSFKKLYQMEWKISAQKEAFVKVLLESWGLRVKPVGIGTLSTDFYEDYFSFPDFAVFVGNTLISYVEVTGGNTNIHPNMTLWIAHHKYNKYIEIYRQVPVYFIYIGFERNIMKFAKYLHIREIDRFSKNIILKEIRGRVEKYIAIPFSIWLDLKHLYREFLQLLR